MVADLCPSCAVLCVHAPQLVHLCAHLMYDVLALHEYSAHVAVSSLPCVHRLLQLLRGMLRTRELLATVLIDRFDLVNHQRTRGGRDERQLMHMAGEMFGGVSANF